VPLWSAYYLKLPSEYNSQHHERVKILVEWLAKVPERSRTILKMCAYGFVAGLMAWHSNSR
jgi:hypothetical protein